VWGRVEGNNATVGITDHAQHELGDIVFVDLPKPGASVAKGKSFGSVESVKAVSDIYSPVSGEVAESNDLLAQSPERLNEDPHGEAWLIKVKVAGDPMNELNGLMSAPDYQKYIGAE
jgi:glycine cleavage system H protein